MNIQSLQQLIDKAEDGLDTLKRLDYKPFATELKEIGTQFREFKNAAQQLLAEGDTLQIGIVGQVKAGKSSFLNALFFNGENVLPRASTPMTAGLTVLEYGDNNTFEVEYFSAEDWKHFEEQNEHYKAVEAECRQEDPAAPEHIIKRMVEQRVSESMCSSAEMVAACGADARAKIGAATEVVPFNDLRNLQQVLERYVGANGAYTSVVKSLRVKIKDERLQGIRIVDTPGVNDPVKSREDRTRTFLYESHGVFLLSASSDFLGSQDIHFLNTRVGEQGIAKVVLLASKFDSVLQDLGAEREMKGQPRASLVDAAGEQQRAFVRRLQSLQDDIVERLRGNIELSYTSGISYALAHKPASEWDDVERNVAQQMQRYYPNDFGANALESYKALANIEEIHNDYLEGTFKQNKETIISDKVEAFTTGNTKALAKQTSLLCREVEQKYKDLQEKSVAQVEQEIAMQGKLFENIKERVNIHAESFNSDLQNAIKKLENTLWFSTTVSLPLENKTAHFTRKGDFWGWDKDDSCDYKGVNSHALQAQVKKQVEDYLLKWASEWQKLFEELEEEFSDVVFETIANAAKKFATTSSFDDDFYRNLVDKCLAKMKLSRVIAVGPIRDKVKSSLESICNISFRCGNYRSLYSDESYAQLAEDAKRYRNDISNRVSNLLGALPREVQKSAQSAVKQATNEIDAMKTTFVKSLEQTAKEYLDELKEELRNKTESLQEIEAFKKQFEQFANLFSTTA